MRHLWLILALAACSGKDDTDPGSSTDDTDDTVDTDDPGDTDVAGRCDGTALEGEDLCTSWIVNTTSIAPVITTEGVDAVEDVQAVSVVEVSGTTYVRVEATAIPSYEVTLTEADVLSLTGRPRAASDFRDGAPLVSAGDTVQFGDDIGYDSTGCRGDEGYGFWPPGPECPEVVSVDAKIPAEVAEATATCWTSGVMGLAVNGVLLTNWTDTFSFENEQTWYNLAPMFEIYDLDVCGGHMNPSGYHHHSSPMCLGDEVGDDGSGHSPIYGWAADGVPVYGPWHAAGVRAESCWKTRDYDDPTSATGCGASGARTCVMADSFDPTAGTVAAAHAGPSTGEVVTSLSGNQFTAVSGMYFEDWYWDAACTADGGPHLDQHNGHDHDGLGYHYHVTSTFPFLFGPTFYGALPANGMAKCEDSPYSSPPPR